MLIGGHCIKLISTYSSGCPRRPGTTPEYPSSDRQLTLSDAGVGDNPFVACNEVQLEIVSGFRLPPRTRNYWVIALGITCPKLVRILTPLTISQVVPRYMQHLDDIAYARFGHVFENLRRFPLVATSENLNMRQVLNQLSIIV